MAYYRAREREEAVKQSYREYVTASLYYGLQRKYITKLWSEIIGQEQADTRTGDEIALDVIQSAGLTVEGSEEPEVRVD